MTWQSLHRSFFRSSDPGRSMACVTLLIRSAPFVSRGDWEVVLHVHEGQNRLFTFHFLHLPCGEDEAGGAWRPLLRRRVRGLFQRRWSWRGRLLAMKREGQGWLRLSLSRSSSPSPIRVSSSNPSRRRWILSFPSSLRWSSSATSSAASFIGGARPSFWWRMVARRDNPSIDLTAAAPGDACL
jgi:hypothetical protein